MNDPNIPTFSVDNCVHMTSNLSLLEKFPGDRPPPSNISSYTSTSFIAYDSASSASTHGLNSKNMPSPASSNSSENWLSSARSNSLENRSSPASSNSSENWLSSARSNSLENRSSPASSNSSENWLSSARSNSSENRSSPASSNSSENWLSSARSNSSENRPSPASSNSSENWLSSARSNSSENRPSPASSNLSENSLSPASSNSTSNSTSFNIVSVVINSESSTEEESETITVPKAKNTKRIFKKSRQHPPDPDLLPPCRICGQKASGFHYGVNTCESCKVFFRRSIVKIDKNKEGYRCTRGERSCKLSAGKRTMCSYCRYQKCLDVGMSKDAIKIGRYSYSKRTSDFVEVQKLKEKDNQSDKNGQNIGCVPKSHMPIDLQHRPVIDMDVADVERLVEQLIVIQEEVNDDYRESFQPNGLLKKHLKIYESYKQKIEYFGNLGAIPRSVYDEIHSLTGMEIDDRNHKMNLIALTMEKYILNMVKFAKNLPGFTGLLPKDQATLLKESFLEYLLFVLHTRINTELRVIVLINGGKPDEYGGHLSEFSNTTDGEECPWSEYAAILQRCQFTVEEATLTLGIIVTFTDRCQIEEPKKVEEIQWNLINRLRSIISKKHTNPEYRLSQIFDKFITLRTFAEHAQELSKNESTMACYERPSYCPRSIVIKHHFLH